MRKKRLPTPERLAELFEYRESDGRLIRRVNVRNGKAGSAAGWLNSDGYRDVRVDGIRYGEHLLVWVLLRGPIPDDKTIDHRDLQRARNVISNLRVASVAQNNANRPVQRSNKLGLKGVYFDKRKGKYRARIDHENRKILLGDFDCPRIAHLAYVQAANRLYGEFARAA
jgi:hypothetical protein